MNAPRATRFRLCLLATGGTIEKTYDAHEGRLVLGQPVIEALVAGLTHPDIAIDIQRLMAVDSLDMQADERAAVVARIQAIEQAGTADAIVVTHGTDTLATTARAIAERIARARAAHALVTGDAVGQVASQTLENLAVVGSVATCRPAGSTRRSASWRRARCPRTARGCRTTRTGCLCR